MVINYHMVKHISHAEKSDFYVEPYKRQKYMILLMRTVDINNIYLKVRSQKNNFREGNRLIYLTQPSIKIQITFEVTVIEYDQIKGENISMECV